MAYFDNKKDDLLDLYLNQNKDGVEIAKIYGVGYSTVYRALEEFGVKRNLSNRGKYYRNQEWISEMRERLRGKKYEPKSEEIRENYKKGALKRIKNNPHQYSLDKNYKSKSGLKNAMLVVYGKDRCFKCGWDEYSDILQVHHKDMNHKNNTLSNCIWLCPNCHYYIHYYEGMGKDVN